MSTKLQIVIGGLAALVALTGATAGPVATARSAADRTAASAATSSPTVPAAATSSPTVPAASTSAPTAPAAEIAAAELAAATAEGIGCVSTRVCTPTHGGAYITTSRNSCTVGLPVRSRAGAWYLLTAGHCIANARGATWRESGYVLGVGTRWQYAGLGTEGSAGSTDVGIIKITANSKLWNARSRVLVVGTKATTQRIVKAADARTGAKVCVTAGRTGTTRCGTVVTPTTSLRYASPGLAARTVQGLALVKGICVNPGDSGSPVFAGSTAVGVAVARSATGCFMWYSKITAPLRQYGLTVAG